VDSPILGVFMRDRFDFEQQLMSCWNITDEIDLLNKSVLEGKVGGGEMTKDEISNYLLGLSTIYSHKFNQLWEDFEMVLMPIVRENKMLSEEVTALYKQLDEAGVLNDQV
jgi:hypothetical protein